MSLDEHGVQKIARGQMDIKRAISTIETTIEMSTLSNSKKTEACTEIIVRFVNELNTERARFYAEFNNKMKNLDESIDLKLETFGSKLETKLEQVQKQDKSNEKLLEEKMKVFRSSILENIVETNIMLDDKIRKEHNKMEAIIQRCDKIKRRIDEIKTQVDQNQEVIRKKQKNQSDFNKEP